MAIELPPVASILMNEDIWACQSAGELEAVFRKRGLVGELRRQGEWTVQEYEYPAVDQGGFVVAPSGSLNPFSGVAKCNELVCRINTAQDFARSTALYADTVVLPDPLTSSFLASRVDYGPLYLRLAVFRELRPLIQDGVIRFQTPVHHFCKKCSTRNKLRLQRAVGRVLEDLVPSLKISFAPSRHKLTVTCPVLTRDVDHPVSRSFRVSPSIETKLGLSSGTITSKAAEYVAERITNGFVSDVNSILFEMSMAGMHGATLLAGSRMEALALSDLDQSRPPLPTIESWENARSIDLPWISALTPAECVVLREEAHYALPRLRALMSERLRRQGDDAAAAAFATEMRAQVAEVESELRSMKSLDSPKYRGAAKGLPWALVLYGLASSIPAVTVAGIAGMLATMHNVQDAHHDENRELSKIQAAPAFALLKAKGLLAGRVSHQEKARSDVLET